MKKVISFILVAVLSLSLTACGIGGGETIAWEEIVLGYMLPEPPVGTGEIHDNTSEELWVDINNLTDKQYADYVAQCEELGFTVEAQSNSSTYTAYNAEGYKLELSHYGSDADMSIQVEKPMEMDAISWPTGIAGKLLPVPNSSIGNVSWEYDDSFYIYVGNTPKEDYDAYINACVEKGFDVDYEKGKTYYHAENSEGWQLSLYYQGNGVMSVNIEPPEESDEPEITTEPAEEETEPETTKEPETTTEPEKEESGAIGADFKAAMDSYEAFMDEYVAFMKKYKANPTDLGLLMDLSGYLSKYEECMEDFEAWDDEDMNIAETAYYLEVQTRVTKKLLEVAE